LNEAIFRLAALQLGLAMSRTSKTSVMPLSVFEV
jgi:hypothetical protein